MDIRSLTEEKKAEEMKLVAVKLSDDLVGQLRKIRVSTGKTNTEVFSALLNHGITEYNERISKKRKKAAAKKAKAVTAKPKNGKNGAKRGPGRPRKNPAPAVVIPDAIDSDSGLD